MLGEMTKKQSFLLGFRKTLPFQMGVLPFGVLYATLATNIGFPGWLVLFFSIVVFGGSSQLVFIDLVQKVSSPFHAVIGSNIVNARHLIYSAGMSSEFSRFSRKWKLILAYFMTDQLYAVFQKEQTTLQALNANLKPWFFFGSGFCTWSLWLASSSIGIAFGKIVPESWNLGFSIPLMFMPLVFLLIKVRSDYFVVLLAAGLTILFYDLPYGLGVFFAILLSSFLGYLAINRVSSSRRKL